MLMFGGETTLFVSRQDVYEFRITFEGVNTGGLTRGGFWVVEGREGGLMPWNVRYFESTEVGREGLTAKSSSRTHTVVIDFRGKHIVYDHAARKLIVDGVSYSTAKLPVYLRIGLDGTVKPQKGPLY